MIDGEAFLVGEHLVGHVVLQTRVLFGCKNSTANRHAGFKGSKSNSNAQGRRGPRLQVPKDRSTPLTFLNKGFANMACSVHLATQEAASKGGPLQRSGLPLADGVLLKEPRNHC
jgi:hypothetical protein